MLHAKYHFFALLFILVFTLEGTSKYDELIDSVRATARIDVDEALVLSEQLIRKGKEDNNSYAIIRGNLISGYLYASNKKESIKGLIYYLDAIKRHELYPDDALDEYVKSIAQNTAAIYKNMNQPEIALDFYSKALKLSTKLNRENDAIWIKRLMSETYQILDEKENSYRLIDEALSSLNLIELEDQYITINSAGIIAERFGDFDRAEHYYSELLNHALANYELDSNESRLNEAFALNNLGNLMRTNGDIQKAIEMISGAIQIRSSYPYLFTGYNFFNQYFDLGKCFSDLKNHSLAIDNFNKAISFKDQFDFHTDKHRIEVYQLLANSYSSIGDFQKATTAQQAYAEYLNQYLFIKEKTAEENQKLNIELITRQYFDSVNNAENDMTLFWVSLVGFGLVLSIASSLGYNSYQKNRLKRKLESEIRRIQSS